MWKLLNSVPNSKGNKVQSRSKAVIGSTTCRDPATVSYTHLDVYKRQGLLESVARYAVIDCKRLPIHTTARATISFVRSMRGIDSNVAYYTTKPIACNLSLIHI